MPVAFPKMSRGGMISLTTGAASARFPSTSCDQLTISNNSGKQLNVQQTTSAAGAAAGAIFPLPDGAIFTFYGLSNANEIWVVASDATVGLTIGARWEEI